MKVILIFLLILNISHSKDNISYFFSPGINLNLHNAGFTNLPGVSDYNYSEYGINSNLKYNIGLGLNYKFDDKMFSIFDSYSLSLIYSDYSIKLNRDELLGNFIKENEYYPIYSEVPIESKINMIGLKNNFWVNIFKPFDIGFLIGANYVISSSFEQKEVALNSTEFTFENGTDTREEYSGDIPDINSLLLNLGAELRYNYKINDNYSLHPSISYNYLLPSLVKGINWNVNSINVNLALSYLQTEKVELPKLIEPEPIMPEEPKIIELYYYIDAYHNNEKLNKGQELDIEYYTKVEKEQYSILPIVYFKTDSEEILENSTSGLFELAINSLINNIASTIKKQDIKKVKLKTGKFIEKDKKLFENRVDNLISMFVEKGLNKNIFNVEYNQVDNLNYRYEELKAEEDKIIFEFDNQKLISFTYYEKEDNYFNNDENFTFKVNYNLDEGVVNNLRIDNNELNNEKEYNFKFEKDSNINSFTEEITYYSNPLSIKSNNLSDTFNINLNYKEINREVISNQLENESYRFILGYFEFDSFNFAAIDNDVLKFVNEAISKGKKVKVIPLTDNIGDDVYNKELAKKRGNAAMKVLSNSDNIEMDLSNKKFFSNEHPYGRTLNRSVIIEIY